MIERAFVHVGGPPGSGKTKFIEAMLAGADALTLAARLSARRHARSGPGERSPDLDHYLAGHPGRGEMLVSSSPGGSAPTLRRA